MTSNFDNLEFNLLSDSYTVPRKEMIELEIAMNNLTRERDELIKENEKLRKLMEDK
ncbi:hypothetical protein [Staphylococcus capitis]|uniref:hypothetical protein n=1 Tax=Staphylococcus capitis TaxID=29388 RepID=UPI00021A2441|nr:hypothetical protein [Staphylococcus capitis]EGS38273.1 hypothetical protein SEVCU116_0388 [Staphylococcus capitis VCU116]MBF2260821.1 hypothetical protein [Staphylococcus capitis]MBF2281255.1 hypothetical protein [Staphylococcus capitis]MBF8029193.1 hypothetical protein [Staphylococcus capitis]MBF8049424.1 hypothetical protein [Staphylococcus capitis]